MSNKNKINNPLVSPFLLSFYRFVDKNVVCLSPTDKLSNDAENLMMTMNEIF